MALSAAQKARLKRLYQDGAVPYAEIAKESGLDRFKFQRLVKEEGWGQRSKPGGAESMAAEPDPDLQKAPPKPKKAAPAALELALVQQIYKTIENELTKLVKQEGSKSQDRERASRALSQIVISFRNAVQMHNEIKAQTKTKPKGRSAQEKEAFANAEDMRRQIAERIERLRLQRTNAK